MWSVISKKSVIKTNECESPVLDEIMTLLDETMTVTIVRKLLLLEELLEQNFNKLLKGSMVVEYNIYEPTEINVFETEETWVPIYGYFLRTKFIKTIEIESDLEFSEEIYISMLDF